MMRFIFFFNTAQNCNCVFHTWLVNQNLLKTTLESRILFDVFAILIQGCCTYHAQLASGKHRLQHIASIHCPIAGAARAHNSVKFINKRNYLTITALDFIKYGL